MKTALLLVVVVATLGFAQAEPKPLFGILKGVEGIVKTVTDALDDVLNKLLVIIGEVVSKLREALEKLLDGTKLSESQKEELIKGMQEKMTKILSEGMKNVDSASKNMDEIKAEMKQKVDETVRPYLNGYALKPEEVEAIIAELHKTVDAVEMPKTA